ALTLGWCFGFSKDLPDALHSLCDGRRRAVAYAAAHTAVIYDYENCTQRLLQGHCNPITAVVVSRDRRHVITADAGPDSMLVVWDSHSGTPIKSIFAPHPNGIAAAACSPDGLWLATLSDPGPAAAGLGDGPQELSVWAWASPGRDDPLCTAAIGEPDLQRRVVFNPSDPRQLMTTGERRTLFWHHHDRVLRGYVPRISRRDFKGSGGGGGRNGSGGPVGSTTAAPPPRRRACKMLALCPAAITTAMTLTVPLLAPAAPAAVARLAAEASLAKSGGSSSAAGGGGGGAGSPKHAGINGGGGNGGAGRRVGMQYVVLGSADGSVRFYDFKFRLEAWFEDFCAGPITSVSFAVQPPPPPVPDAAAGPSLRGGASFSICGGPGISAATAAAAAAAAAATSAKPAFRVPDFVVGAGGAVILGATAAMFERLDPAERRGVPIVRGFDDAIVGLAPHPRRPRVAALCRSGDLHLWDYDGRAGGGGGRGPAPAGTRLHCLAYGPSGRWLAVGLSSGGVRLLDGDTLEDAAWLNGGDAPLSLVRVSPDGDTIAAADDRHHVLLWRHAGPAPSPPLSPPSTAPAQLPQTGRGGSHGGWEYVGRHRAHTAAVTGLEFGRREDGSVALVSVGADRCLVEYDLTASTSAECGLLLVAPPRRVEQTAMLTALMWHPLLGGEFEDRVVTANDGFKLRQWNADNKACRRTALGPTFGGPVARLAPLMHMYSDGTARPSEYVAYAAADKVVGLMKLPLDGDPNKSMGLIAHPGAVSGLGVSGDGHYLFTAGGADLALNMWRVNTAAMDAMEAAGSSGGGEGTSGRASGGAIGIGSNGGSCEAFVEQLEGGRGGDLYDEVVDYFLLAQLQNADSGGSGGGGADGRRPRDVTGRVPLSALPELMRALGYYPSEAEITDMTAEARYANFTATGQTETSIDLASFLRLFVNHRPVFPVSKQSLDAGAGAAGSGPGAVARISTRRLVDMLTGGSGSGGNRGGEPLGREELERCLEVLTGEPSLSGSGGGAGGGGGSGSGWDAGEFAQRILGFEDHRPEAVPLGTSGT
ncbi:unnamed protein product, partial [Phaeothamnion confervicola]